MGKLTAFQSGNHLEYMVAGMFQSQGYLVRRSVALAVDNGGSDATDIDVLGVKFTRPFQPNRVVCDCKDRARTRPFERVLWAKGLSGFLGVSDTYVALPRASRDVIHFAKLGNVRVLPAPAIQEVVDRAFEGRGTGYGQANEQFYPRFIHAIQQYVRTDSRVEETLSQVRRQLISANPYAALNLCVIRMQEIVEQLKSTVDPLASAAWRFVASETAVVVSVLVLGICGDTMGMNHTDREHRIITGLTYGDMSPAKAEELFRLTQKLAFEAAGIATPSTGFTPTLAVGRVPAPVYADDVCGLVERALSTPEVYHELPQALDTLLFEFAVQGREFPPETYTVYLRGLMTPERIKGAKNVLAFLQTATGFQQEWLRPSRFAMPAQVETRTYGRRSARCKSAAFEGNAGQLNIPTHKRNVVREAPQSLAAPIKSADAEAPLPIAEETANSPQEEPSASPDIVSTHCAELLQDKVPADAEDRGSPL
jgi:hypothetical protein